MRTEIVKYFISGRLPATWEDFVPADGFENFPKVSIYANNEQESISDINDGGWMDVELMGDTITKEIAVNILSIICDNRKVELEERGFCQAV